MLGVVTQLLGSNAAAAPALAGMTPTAMHPIDSAAALTSVATIGRVWRRTSIVTSARATEASLSGMCSAVSWITAATSRSPKV